jgi:SAM-dependent methyltransferase
VLGVDRGTYAELADEYYDSVWHPTCANLREASASIVSRFVQEASERVDCAWCDLGAGKSIVVEQLQHFRQFPSSLILVDSVRGMLHHSVLDLPPCAQPVASDARRLPLRNSSVGAVVISLGDPFNGDSLWREMQRVVRPGGRVCFTTPSYLWAQHYRSIEGSPHDAARFRVRSGRDIYVDSVILPTEGQKKLVRSHGFTVLWIEDIPPSTLNGPLSPKLRDIRTIVTGYVLERVGE